MTPSRQIRPAHQNSITQTSHKPSFGSIIVYAGWSPASDDLVRCSVSIANRFGARIYGVTTPALVQGPRGRGAAVLTGLEAAVHDSLEALIQESMDLVEERFRALTALSVRGASWTWTRSPAIEALERASHAGDLILIRPSYVWPRPSFCSKSFSSALYLGRPVLVAPISCSRCEGDNVVVFWNDNAACRRAVSDAMPFLTRARRVTLIHYPVRLDPFDARSRLEEVAEALERRDVAAEVQVLARSAKPVSAVLVQAAARRGADLIVAGAYGRSGWRRSMAASTTDALVRRSKTPLLLSR